MSRETIIGRPLATSSSCVDHTESGGRPASGPSCRTWPCRSSSIRSGHAARALRSDGVRSSTVDDLVDAAATQPRGLCDGTNRDAVTRCAPDGILEQGPIGLSNKGVLLNSGQDSALRDVQFAGVLGHVQNTTRPRRPCQDFCTGALTDEGAR